MPRPPTGRPLNVDLPHVHAEAHPAHKRAVGELVRGGDTPTSEYIERRKREEAEDPIVAAVRAEIREGR